MKSNIDNLDVIKDFTTNVDMSSFCVLSLEMIVEPMPHLSLMSLMQSCVDALVLIFNNNKFNIKRVKWTACQHRICIKLLLPKQILCTITKKGPEMNNVNYDYFVQKHHAEQWQCSVVKTNGGSDRVIATMSKIQLLAECANDFVVQAIKLCVLEESIVAHNCPFAWIRPIYNVIVSIDEKSSVLFSRINNSCENASQNNREKNISNVSYDNGNNIDDKWPNDVMIDPLSLKYLQRLCGCQNESCFNSNIACYRRYWNISEYVQQNNIDKVIFVAREILNGNDAVLQRVKNLALQKLRDNTNIVLQNEEKQRIDNNIACHVSIVLYNIDHIEPYILCLPFAANDVVSKFLPYTLPNSTMRAMLITKNITQDQSGDCLSISSSRPSSLLFSEILPKEMALNKISNISPNILKCYHYFILFFANNMTDDTQKMFLIACQSHIKDVEFFCGRDLILSQDMVFNKLKTIEFHSCIGSIADHMRYMEYLLDIFLIYQLHYAAIKDSLLLAIQWCKYDLCTNIANEFKELKGLASAIYAARFGVSQFVCDIIEEHYLPINFATKLPHVEAAIISLLDKLNLILAIGQQNQLPNGTQDPFAIRRLAIGVMRIVMKYRFSFSIGACCALYQYTPEQILNIWHFFIDRAVYIVALLDLRDVHSSFGNDIKLLNFDFCCAIIDALLQDKIFNNDKPLDSLDIVIDRAIILLLFVRQYSNMMKIIKRLDKLLLSKMSMLQTALAESATKLAMVPKLTNSIDKDNMSYFCDDDWYINNCNMHDVDNIAKMLWDCYCNLYQCYNINKNFANQLMQLCEILSKLDEILNTNRIVVDEDMTKTITRLLIINRFLLLIRCIFDYRKIMLYN